MDTPWLIALFVLAMVALGIGAYFAWRAEQKRREELAALAASLGWSFDPEKDIAHDDEYAQFEVFRRGHSRAAYNTLAGSLEVDGRRFRGKAGDFTYKVTTSNGKTTSTTTYRFSYLILHPPFAQVPDLLIRREGLFDKLLGAIGFDDIDFESSEFSRRFHVKSPDKRFAYDVCHPRMMEFLLTGDPPAIDLERGACCLSDGGRRWSPEQFREMMTWAAAFFDLWPDHLTRELETRAT